MIDVILDALKDTAIVMPVLLIVYFLIEFLEYKQVFNFEKSSLLRGRLSPVFGSFFGIVPQCGFSVISTDLYAEKKISIGALIAVYIATSDEAIPLMISQPKSIPYLLLLVAIKMVFGVCIGYFAMFLYGKIFGGKENISMVGEVEIVEKEHHEGCCNHHFENPKFNFIHPLLHSLKIAGFILLINLIFGFIVYFVGSDKITVFLESSFYFQPLFAILVGLIPNCVASVILTEMFLMQSISFGSIVAGLSVNAGLGLLILFKQNKKIKENVFIVLMLVIPSLVLGYVLHLLI